jgi:hypothetical protein
MIVIKSKFFMIFQIQKLTKKGQKVRNSVTLRYWRVFHGIRTS